MEIDSELTEKSAKNTQRWWKLTAAMVVIGVSARHKGIYKSVFLLRFSWSQRSGWGEFMRRGNSSKGHGVV